MFPKINQNIFLNVPNEDQSYRSIVAEIDENEILIGFPVEADLIGFLPDGTELEITYITSGSLYRFHTQIVGRKNDTIRLYRVIKPSNDRIKKVQRRDNFRVYTNLKLNLNDLELTTINISAGGALFASNTYVSFTKGEVVTGTLFVPNVQSKVTEAIAFKGQVKRIAPTEHDNIKNIAIEFTHVNQRDQSKIVQYCFERQRQMR